MEKKYTELLETLKARINFKRCITLDNGRFLPSWIQILVPAALNILLLTSLRGNLKNLSRGLN